MSKIAVMSLSGGMDSTGLLIDLIADGYSVHAISFDYGQKHRIEIDKAVKNIEYLFSNGIIVEHDIIDLKSITNLLQSNSMVNFLGLSNDSLEIIKVES